MTDRDVIKAWKDEEFRRGLSEAELSALPENPAGAVELTDADLDAAGGDLLAPIWDPFGSLFNCSYDFYGGCGTGCIQPCGNTWGGGGAIGGVCPY